MLLLNQCEMFIKINHCRWGTIVQVRITLETNKHKTGGENLKREGDQCDRGVRERERRGGIGKGGKEGRH